MENETLATEMLKELKATSRRKDYIIVLLILVITILVGFFVWYVNTPYEETEVVTYSQDADTKGDNSAINQDIGE